MNLESVVEIVYKILALVEDILVSVAEMGGVHSGEYSTIRFFNWFHYSRCYFCFLREISFSPVNEELSFMIVYHLWNMGNIYW